MVSKKDEKLSNFLPINRNLFNHWLWTEKRTYSNAEAFLWLIAQARFEAEAATELIGGKMVTWNRGELPASIRFLADTWCWQKNRVDRFLKLLEKENMIRRRLVQSQTVITLINYEVFNKKGQQTGHLKSGAERVLEESRDSKRDSDGTAAGQRRDNTNIDNIVNNENSIAACAKTHTDEEKEMFKKFQEWVKTNCPRISEMKEPFTIEQYVKLRQNMKREEVTDLLYKMHNWEPLTKRNRSAYLTIMNWKRMEDKRDKKITTPTLTNGTIAEQIREATSAEKNG